MSNDGTTDGIEDELRGTGGWLGIWIGLQCFIVAPLSIVGLAVLATYASGLSVPAFLMLAAIYLLNFLGFTGAVLMWQERRRGLDLTRLYLSTILALTVVNTVVGTMATANEPQGPTQLGWGLWALAFQVGWFLYFRRSERVRITFGRDHVDS